MGINWSKISKEKQNIPVYLICLTYLSISIGFLTWITVLLINAK